MKVLVIPIGSSGDVHPLLGIAIKLRDRGHDVLFVTNEHFKPLAVKAGLAFEALGTAEEYHNAINDPDIWHPTKGTQKVLEWSLLGLLNKSYDIVARHHVPGETILIGAALCLGARVAHDKLNVPLITTQLQPMAIYSHAQPPRYSGMPAWAPAWMRRSMFKMGEKIVVDPILLKPLNQFRKELGLEPLTGGIFSDYINSPQLVLGLFPEWFAGPPPDWPSQVLMPGFPLYDEKGLTALDAELEDFLNDGSPPIAFTPGSAMLQARFFFNAAAEACHTIGRRALLLTRYAENIPPTLPPGVKHFAYAPFSAILPRCAALVHHGGIGTMAQALHAGIPQLIMPMAHDQPDNAFRAEQLGVALSLSRKNFTPENLSPLLRRLVEEPAFSQHAREVARKFDGIRPVDASCDAIEALARKLGVLKNAPDVVRSSSSH